MLRELDKKGFSLIFAIFMLVIFAVIGASVVTMLTTSTESSSEDLLYAQALYLAESGKEIRIMEAIKGDVSNGNKNYFFIENNNLKIEVSLRKLSSIPDNESLYLLNSTGNVFHIRRKIKVKFIR